MKNANAKHIETVIGFVKTNPNSTVDTIREGTKLSDILLRGVLKTLQEDGTLATNGEDGGYEFTGTTKKIETAKEEKKADKKLETKAMPKTKTKDESDLGPATPSGRDYSKYDFNGMKGLTKGKLALAIIQKYVEDNPKATLAKMEELFESKVIQARYGVLEELTVQTNRQALTSDELSSLEKHDFGYDATLQKTKMIFLFSTYTGLRFSDAMALTEANLVNDSQSGRVFIQTIQLKTKQPVQIPLLLPAKKVLDFFAPQRQANGGRLLGQVSNQRCNSRLREIQGILKFRSRLSTHIARHTFATVVLLETGIDLKSVSSLLGHSSIKSSEEYSRITKNKLIKVAEQVEAEYLKRAKTEA